MITITTPQTPDYWLPSANPIIYTISTTSTQPRLTYHVDVYINGAIVTKLKYPVYDRTNISLDLSSIVNDYLSESFVNDLTVNAGHFYFNPSETCSLALKVTEEYWNGTQYELDTAGSVLAKEIYIWLAGANFQQSRNLPVFEQLFKWDSYNNRYHPKFFGAKNDAFAGIVEVERVQYIAQPQAFKNAYKIDVNTPRTIGFFTYGYDTTPAAISDVYYIWVYNSKLQRTKEYVFNNPDVNALLLNSYSKAITQMPCSPYNINLMVDNNEWSAINITTYGSTQYISQKDDDKYYVVFTHEGWGISGAYEWGYRAVPFVIEWCSRYQVYNILYKTLEGSWWQIRTEMKSQKETDVKRSVMYNTWGLQAAQIMPNSKTFKRVMHVEGNGTITLNTDWIGNQGVIEEIEEMILSPSIYLVTDDGMGNVLYIPVVLKDSNYRIYNKQQDKLIQYEFEFEEGYQKTTLR